MYISIRISLSLCVCIVYFRINMYTSRNRTLFIAMDNVWPARRRSTVRWRSARTSARGTPPAWSTCPGYARSRPAARLRGVDTGTRDRSVFDAVCLCVRTHAGVCARPAHVARYIQAFSQASAFNANIGAWNTAAVTTLSSVCAVSAARSMRHHRVCGEKTICASAHVSICVGA